MNLNQNTLMHRVPFKCKTIHISNKLTFFPIKLTRRKPMSRPVKGKQRKADNYITIRPPITGRLIDY